MKKDKKDKKEYFKNVDNEYKAYILGFIFADGYIEANERSLTFNINKKDIKNDG